MNSELCNKVDHNASLCIENRRDPVTVNEPELCRSRRSIGNCEENENLEEHGHLPWMREEKAHAIPVARLEEEEA